MPYVDSETEFYSDREEDDITFEERVYTEAQVEAEPTNLVQVNTVECARLYPEQPTPEWCQLQISELTKRLTDVTTRLALVENELTLTLRVRPQSGPLNVLKTSTRAYNLLKFWDDIYYTVTGQPFDENQYDQTWLPQKMNGGNPIDITKFGWYTCRKMVDNRISTAKQFIRAEWMFTAFKKDEEDELDGFENLSLEKSSPSKA